MARVRSTARVEREGGEAEGSETVPISEAMQRSGLVTSKEIPTVEAEQATAEAEEENIEENIEETDPEDDYRIAMPSKPSHLDFGKSTSESLLFRSHLNYNYAPHKSLQH
jgi:hypothetical protein